MTTDMRDNEENKVKGAEEDFKHKQGNKEVEQTNGGELHRRLEACKWEFTSGQSEGLSVVLRQLIYLATWCLHNRILWKLVEDL